ncbi:unnamed protein product [marine sediment metagenome]|uniref:Uncharacterized protein n=1 Tax=marine sediment metagenome TaxID=412755 RepID=X1U2Z2_9ZZZZ
MEEEERKEITKMIEGGKGKIEEIEIIEQCIREAFETGRIEEKDYYSLLLNCKK